MKRIFLIVVIVTAFIANSFANNALLKQEIDAHPKHKEVLSLIKRSLSVKDREKEVNMLKRLLSLLVKKREPYLWAAIQNNLANAFSDRIRGSRAQNIEHAIADYKKALEVYTKEDFPTDWAMTQNNLANAFMVGKHYRAAINAYEAVLEQNQKMVVYQALLPSYQKELLKKSEDAWANLALAFIEMGEFERAFFTLERGRVRLGKSRFAIEQKIAKLPKAKREKLSRQLQKIRALKVALEKSRGAHLSMQLIEKYKKSQRAFRKELNILGVDSRKSSFSKRRLLEKIAALPSRYALVAPFFSQYGSGVFVVQGGSRTIDKRSFIPLKFTKEKLQAVAQEFFTDVYAGRRRDTIKKIIKELEGGVAFKIAQKLNSLQSVKSLIYLPASYLSYLPLGACSYQGRALFERYTFYRLSNLYKLQKIDAKSQNKKRLFAAINPTRDLFYTPVEGEIVSAMFKKPTLLKAKSATKRGVLSSLKQTYDYIYFSGHGAFDIDNPMQTGLFMSDKKKLTLSDISTLGHLKRSRLVVLSACQTDMRDLSLLSESINLPEAFLQAGARGVVSTLWSVDDAATMFLTTKFFELHIQRGVAPAAALAQAKSWLRNATARELSDVLDRYMHRLHNSKKLFLRLALLKKELIGLKERRPYSDPYYWAGFVYSGL